MLVTETANRFMCDYSSTCLFIWGSQCIFQVWLNYGGYVKGLRAAYFSLWQLNWRLAVLEREQLCTKIAKWNLVHTTTHAQLYTVIGKRYNYFAFISLKTHMWSKTMKNSHRISLPRFAWNFFGIPTNANISHWPAHFAPSSETAPFHLRNYRLLNDVRVFTMSRELTKCNTLTNTRKTKMLIK